MMAHQYRVQRPAPKWAGQCQLSLAGFLAAFVLAGCGGEGAAGAGPEAAPTPVQPTTIQLADVNGMPISGGVVTVVGGGMQVQATSGADGVARLQSAPVGDVSMTITAPSFETLQLTTRLPGGVTAVGMTASGEWALGRAFVLGARMLDRAVDGSTLTFTVDVAVIDANRSAIQNLTSNDFGVQAIDCGWGGPRDCASDAQGNAPPSGGQIRPDTGAESFSLQPSSARRPYVASVLVERSRGMYAWPAVGPALKHFFQAVAGNDAASLATVAVVNGAPVTNVLGEYSSNGLPYLAIIDQLATPAIQDSPAVLQSLQEIIQRVAAARNTVTSGADPFVVVLARGGLSVAEFNALSAVARQAGVRIGVIGDGSGSYGLTELAIRSGGFAVQYSDARQLALIFGALDSMLARSQPFYRMTFRIKGAPGTFVAGGNAKIWLRVRVPTSMPSRGVGAQFDVPIQ